VNGDLAINCSGPGGLRLHYWLIIISEKYSTPVMLIALFVWKHCNGCVCEGMNPSINQLLQEIREEPTIWCSAGASELESLWALIFVWSGG